ncbi:RNA polymerase-binding protein RbpA [Actinomycetaceae bacterium TAE3-ERU4]|nr:RNA polymerase-binding protein RbpA [Actinomycetaceae bacterium TAE3-ERU4]
MADRVLRGMSIGANSLESEKGVVFVDRVEVRYECACGTIFSIPFSIEAEPPASWVCSRCGETANLVDSDNIEEESKGKTQRTHWDMLCERRTEEELEVLLQEQLEALRSGRLRTQRYRRSA